MFDALGLSAAMLRLQGRIRRSHIRIVNYHDIPSSLSSAFANQLRFFRSHYVPVNRRDLEDVLSGTWRHNRPGLMITFDDGLRSHFDVAAPLLERFGFSGWFFVPSAFPKVPIEQQLHFAKEHKIFSVSPEQTGRIAMTWEELRTLDQNHVVGCHTMNHRRLRSSLTADELTVEIPEAKVMMEENLGREVPDFCWVGGEEWSYSGSAASAIRDAGFRFGFMTNNAMVRCGTDPLQLQRTNVEAHFALPLVRFQLCGFLDCTYLPKRRRVNRLTAARIR